MQGVDSSEEVKIQSPMDVQRLLEDYDAEVAVDGCSIVVMLAPSEKYASPEGHQAWLDHWYYRPKGATIIDYDQKIAGNVLKHALRSLTTPQFYRCTTVSHWLGTLRFKPWALGAGLIGCQKKAGEPFRLVFGTAEQATRFSGQITQGWCQRDKDEVECENCHRILDIEDSIRDGGSGEQLLCVGCFESKYGSGLTD